MRLVVFAQIKTWPSQGFNCIEGCFTPICPDKTLLLLNESDVTDYLALPEIRRPLGKLGIPCKTSGVPLEYVMVIARGPGIY